MNKQELIEKLKRLRDRYPVDDSHEGVRQGLLIAIGMIDQLLEPTEAELLVIPQFVADWWDGDSVTMYGGERINKKYKLRLISSFHDRGLGDYLSKVEDWLDENDSTFLDLVNGKPYEVEKEKLYYVLDKNNHTMLHRSFDYSITQAKSKYAVDPTRKNFNLNKYELTEQEIRNYDARFMAFAVEVTE